jgi:hypothetical protein
LNGFSVYAAVGDVVFEDGWDLLFLFTSVFRGQSGFVGDLDSVGTGATNVMLIVEFFVSFVLFLFFGNTSAKEGKRKEKEEGMLIEMRLTVGKYPSVNTLSKLVFPQAPSPIITSFLYLVVR